MIPIVGFSQIAITPTQDVDMTTLASLNYDTSKLSADIVTIGGNPDTSSKIQEYFETGKIMDGKKRISFINYKDEWINLAQYSIEELNIKTLGPIASKEELIKKLNYLIGEHAKVIASKIR